MGRSWIRLNYFIQYRHSTIMAKPNMRNLLLNWSKQKSVYGIAVTALGVAAWNWGVRLPRIKAIDEWQRNLNIDEDYIFKRDQGSFKSAAPYGWRWKDYEWPCKPEDDEDAPPRLQSSRRLYRARSSLRQPQKKHSKSLKINIVNLT